MFEFVAVFNVLILSYGNLNKEIFLFASCSFDLLLVTIVLVESAAALSDKVKLLSLIIASIIFVSVLPLSFINDIESSFFNSVVNLVLKPVTAAEAEQLIQNQIILNFLH